MLTKNRSLVALAAASALALLGGGVAGAAARGSGAAGPSRVVFVQTDNLAGNQVVAYDRDPATGALTLAGAYATGGLGGQQNGSVVDHLASQGGLAYSPRGDVLIAVNAGSNSISTFRVHGDALQLRQVLPSGGAFPSSVAVSGDLVYVLNAQAGGSVAGFRLTPQGDLHPIEGSVRPLGLTTPADATQFTHTPGQVAFSPDGRSLLVTTKATTSAIDVFAVRRDGRLAATPVVNVEPGAVPFAVIFDAAGRAVVADAGTNALTTFSLGANGVLTAISTGATNQVATCWVSEAQGAFFASNAGSASVSAFSEAANGQLGAPTTTGTDPGTVDAAATPDGSFLYVQGGLHGTVDAFRVGAGGSLSAAGSWTVPGAAGGEGIVVF